MPSFKIGIIVKRTKGKRPKKGGIKPDSVVCLDRHLKSYITEYLDEVHKQHLRVRRNNPKAPARALQQRGLDYQSRQEQGLVTVHGYLRKSFVERNGKNPEMTPKNELSDAVTQAIRHAAVKYGNARQGSAIATRFVFSLSKETSQIWNEAGLDVDVNLRLVVEKTLDRFKEVAQDGKELGFAIGIHHDTAHYHAHMILMTRDESGRDLRLSNRLKVKQPDGTEIRVDFLNLLIGTANSVLRQLHQNLDTPTLRLGFTSRLGDDFDRWIALAAADRVPPGATKEEADRWASTERDRLQSLPLPQLTEILDAAFEKRLATYQECLEFAETTDGAARLRQNEDILLAQVEGQVKDHFVRRDQERTMRKDTLNTLKQQRLELHILRRLQRLSHRRPSPILRREIQEIYEEYHQLVRKSPLLEQMIQERIRLAEGKPADRAARSRLGLERISSGKRLRNWVGIARKQRDNGLQRSNGAVRAHRAVTQANVAREESMMTLLYILRGARTGKMPVLLERYQRVRDAIEESRALPEIGAPVLLR